MSAGYSRGLDCASTALTWLFVAEVALKLLGLGVWGYFSDAFNAFDLLVVALGLLEMALTVRGPPAARPPLLSLPFPCPGLQRPTPGHAVPACHAAHCSRPRISVTPAAAGRQWQCAALVPHPAHPALLSRAARAQGELAQGRPGLPRLASSAMRRQCPSPCPAVPCCGRSFATWTACASSRK